MAFAETRIQLSNASKELLEQLHHYHLELRGENQVEVCMGYVIPLNLLAFLTRAPPTGQRNNENLLAAWKRWGWLQNRATGPRPVTSVWYSCPVESVYGDAISVCLGKNHADMAADRNCLDCSGMTVEPMML